MSRFELAIADMDREYVEELSGYIMMYHSYRFRVYTFSDQEKLKQYLSGEKGFDILMVHEKMLPDPEDIKKCGYVIMLSEGFVAGDQPSSGAVDKYQHMEQLISKILAVVSDGKQETLKGHDQGGRAKVFAFFSPAGGLQKTAAALSMAVTCASKGARVFYLNLQKMQLVEQIFGGCSEKGISDVIYFLRDNSANLAIKIDSYKIVDSRYGVSYFGKPQNLFDLCEIAPDEFERLIKILKYEGGYQYLVLDMAGIGKHFINVIPETDTLFFMPEPEALSFSECGLCVRDLVRISDTNCYRIMDRIFFIAGSNHVVPDDLKGLNIKLVSFPDMPKVSDCTEIRDSIRPGTRFSEAIAGLMDIAPSGEML